MTHWLDGLKEMPLIAILRGLLPEEAEAVGIALVEAGFRCLEVPLNSPRPLDSIAILRRAVGDRALVGAGTVLSVGDVAAVADAGSAMAISPNMVPAVIQATKARGLVSLPGIATPTEAFAALDAGADAIKLFPAEAHSPGSLRAMRAVLPASTAVFPVGGIDGANLAAWRRAGATGAGIGSCLFKPGHSASDVGRIAIQLTAAWFTASA